MNLDFSTKPSLLHSLHHRPTVARLPGTTNQLMLPRVLAPEPWSSEAVTVVVVVVVEVAAGTRPEDFEANAFC